MELAKRVRAARGYAGLNQPQLAARLGVSTSTLKRLESGGKLPRNALEARALPEQVAEACGLPLAFFYIDFASLAQAQLDDNGRIIGAERRGGDTTLQRIDQNVAELLERWREQAMPAFTAYLDRVATEAPDGASEPSAEASAPTQGHP